MHSAIVAVESNSDGQERKEYKKVRLAAAAVGGAREENLSGAQLKVASFVFSH